MLGSRAASDRCHREWTWSLSTSARAVTSSNVCRLGLVHGTLCTASRLVKHNAKRRWHKFGARRQRLGRISYTPAVVCGSSHPTRHSSLSSDPTRLATAWPPEAAGYGGADRGRSRAAPPSARADRADPPPTEGSTAADRGLHRRLPSRRRPSRRRSTHPPHRVRVSYLCIYVWYVKICV